MSKATGSGKPSGLSARGWCKRCGCEHFLPVEPALQHCQNLMKQLAHHKRIGFAQAAEKQAPDCATSALFGPAGGKMFGILTGRDSEGHQIILRAFSGQYNGHWLVEGWAAPLLDPDRLLAISQEREKEIKALGQRLEDTALSFEARRAIKKMRAQLSAQLMREIHELYQLPNFRGETLPLLRLFQGPGMPPSGTGDCCAPKLLRWAAALDLRPESLAEFYWGRDNRAGTRRQGFFYPPCAKRCQPLLGFMLCGAKDL